MTFARFSGMLNISFLVPPDTLEQLFRELNPYFVRTDKVTQEPVIPLEELLTAYKTYWETRDIAFLRRHFQLALTTTLEAIEFLPVHVAKAKAPVVMIRPCKEGGLEALYPRIFQEGGSGIIHKTFPPGPFPNTELFQKLQRFLRAHTVPQKGTHLRILK